VCQTKDEGTGRDRKKNICWWGEFKFCLSTTTPIIFCYVHIHPPSMKWNRILKSKRKEFFTGSHLFNSHTHEDQKQFFMIKIGYFLKKKIFSLEKKIINGQIKYFHYFKCVYALHLTFKHARLLLSFTPHSIYLHIQIWRLFKWKKIF
jgi:hypothetical protein